MLTNDDRDFFEQLNKNLAAQVSAALSKGGGGGQALKDNTEATEEQTKTGVRVAAAMTAGAKAFSYFAGVFKGIQGESRSLGDVLGRAAIATNRQQLLGIQLANKQAPLANALPAITNEFQKFGISLPKAAETISSAIKANIKDTSQSTQKFLAASIGLGGGLANTNKFLATQTNVLGTSTESSIALGENIMAMASANGLLVDALYDAVDAFKETTRRQQSLLGPEAAAEVQRLVAGFEALAPGAGMGELVRALTSPEAIRTLPATASVLGISAPTDLRDPSQIRQFVLAAIPALAEFQQSQIAGVDPLAGFQISENLTNAFNQAFNLSNLQRANVLATAAGGDLATALNAAVITSEEMEAKQRAATGVSEDASMALQNFSLALATTQSNFNTLDTVNEKVRNSALMSAEKILEGGGIYLDTAAKIEAAFSRLGISLEETIKTLGVFIVGMKGAQFAKMVKGWLPGAGKAAQAATGASTAATMSKEALSQAVKGLDDAALAKAGLARNSAGRVIDVASKKFPTNKAIIEAVEQSSLKGASKLATATRVLGRFAVPLGGAVEAYSEFKESGDVSRAASVGLTSAGGTLAGAKAGAALGAFAGPAGVLIGGLVGAIGGGILGATVGREGHDLVEDLMTDPEVLNAREEARLEWERSTQEERDARWEERQQQRHEEHMTYLRTLIEGGINITPPPSNEAYRVEGFGNPYDYMGTASAGGN